MRTCRCSARSDRSVCPRAARQLWESQEPVACPGCSQVSTLKKIKPARYCTDINGWVEHLGLQLTGNALRIAIGERSVTLIERSVFSTNMLFIAYIVHKTFLSETFKFVHTSNLRVCVCVFYIIRPLLV